MILRGDKEKPRNKFGSGQTFNPSEEFCKLPNDKKQEFVEAMVKVIEKNEMEKREKK